ncbi:MAG: alanine--glyoxylate aminotransferase family protein [Sulfurospirillum sp.]|nr:alanine--glyoxylate aminotransferase family protein [Sulfurospirillum sp.]MBL0702983.1 alanine--glyoxylate aminotransferase family protein [Sulfurospirillum sp.]
MLLLTPGPTPVPENIRMAMSEPTIHHRTSEFEEIFAKTKVLLKELFNMEEVLMLASSGTGAMEACVLNLCKSKALTINAGKFGERFSEICKAHGKDFTELKYDWDTPANIDDIVNSVKNDKKIDAIFIQICESSGGLRHPVEIIAKELKKIRPKIMIVADGITAVGVEKIDTTNIDALISGSQKALMLPPGLALIGLSHDGIKIIKESGAGYYLNLKIELAQQKNNTTAYTSATTLIVGLKTILEQLHVDGFNKLYIDTKRRSHGAKKALKEIGLTIFPKSSAVAMSAVYDKDAMKIRELLKSKYMVNIAGGQNHLKTTLFRINHMGLVDDYKTAWTLNAIEIVLEEIGRRSYNGTANKIFTKEIIQ